MAMQYYAYNGPMLTTGGYAPVATGTALKTMMQLVAPAASPMLVWKWGVDFDGTASAVPVRCELLTTGTVAAAMTGTFYATTAIQQYGTVQGVTSAVQLGTLSLSAFNGGAANTGEGAIVATRTGSFNSVPMGNGDRNEWSLGREFYVPPGNVLRIRVTAPVTVNCLCWVAWEE